MNNKKNKTEFKLEKQSELRIESKNDVPIKVQMTEGFSEVFGAELVKNKDYIFKNTSIAIHTWHGCKIIIEGNIDDKNIFAYVSNETPMVKYVNVHGALHKLRQEAKQTDERGPIVMIVGPTNAGKTTLSRLLANWAVNCGHHPILVDLDVGQNNICVPGSIAATPMETGIPPDGEMFQAPVTYFYGHTTPNKQLSIYKDMVENLSDTVKKRLKNDPSGMIINTCGWIKDEGYDLILHAATTYEVGLILVLGDEKLYARLKKEEIFKSIGVVSLRKSGGVIERQRNERAAYRKQSYRKYFYGKSNNLSPMTKIVTYLQDVIIYKIGRTEVAPSHTLPIGEAPKVEKNEWEKLASITQLPRHSVLGVSFAETENEIKTSSVAGFVVVQNVDIHEQKLTLLVPTGGALPGKFLLKGSDNSCIFED